MTTLTFPNPGNLGTGEYKLVVPRGSRAAHVQQQVSGAVVTAEPAARWWRGAGAGFIWTGLAGVVGAGFFAWIYVLLTGTLPDGAPARVLAICAAVSLLIASLVAILLGCKARTDERMQRAATAELVAKLDSNAAAIVASQGRTDLVWDELLTEVGRAVGVHAGKLAEAVNQRLGQMDQRIAAVGELVDRRLDEIEQRMDEQDGQIADLRTIASVFAQPSDGNGQVRQLRPR